MDFTPKAEYEVIRETVPHKLDRPLVNPSNNVLRELTQIKNPTLLFKIGDSLRYANEVHNDMM